MLITLLIWICKILEWDVLEHSFFGFQLYSMINFAMLNQLEYSMKPQSATNLFAFVWFGLSMPSLMLLKIATRGETLWAEVAFKRAAARVSPLMHHEIWLVAESLATNLHSFRIFCLSNLLFHVFIIMICRTIIWSFQISFLSLRAALILEICANECRSENGKSG